MTDDINSCKVVVIFLQEAIESCNLTRHANEQDGYSCIQFLPYYLIYPISIAKGVLRVLSRLNIFFFLNEDKVAPLFTIINNTSSHTTILYPVFI